MTSKKLKIAIEEEFVLLINSQGKVVYTMSKSELSSTRDKIYSEWIMHLLTKTWITIEILYDLAVFISKEFPDNSIDWHATFFVVEKKHYLDFAGDLLLPKKESGVENLFNKIEFGRNESNEETHQIIEDIVTQKLKEYNLN